MEWCEQEVLSDQKKIVYLTEETGRDKSSRYIILLKVKRVCRLDFRPEYGHNGFA